MLDDEGKRSLDDPLGGRKREGRREATWVSRSFIRVLNALENQLTQLRTLHTRNRKIVCTPLSSNPNAGNCCLLSFSCAINPPGTMFPVSPLELSRKSFKNVLVRGFFAFFPLNSEGKHSPTTNLLPPGHFTMIDKEKLKRYLLPKSRSTTVISRGPNRASSPPWHVTEQSQTIPSAAGIQRLGRLSNTIRG